MATAQIAASLDDFMTISSFPTEHRDSAVLGSIPFKVAVADQRASYCMYIPESAFNAVNETDSKLSLVVNVHGTSRRAEQGAAVLAPLFPCGIIDPNDADNYKEIFYKGIRYNQLLIGILEEVKVRREGIIEIEKFFLMGYSGGGQFALRFLYLRPEKLYAASIGAPGTVTSLDSTPWPRGVSNTIELFGVQVEPARIRDVRLHVVVGELDNSVAGEGVRDVVGGQVGAASRVETLVALHKSWGEAGIESKLDIVA